MQLEAVPPALLVPVRGDEGPRPARDDARKRLRVGRADVAGLRGVRPLPGRPEDAHDQRLHGNGRHPHLQAGYLASGDRIEVLADGIDVPVVQILVFGLDRGPREPNEVDQTVREGLCLFLEALYVDRTL